MSVNRVILIGNLTKSPELKATPSGDAVCNFSIACNERYKNKAGEKQEKVEYINIVAWRKLAEICEKYLHKGKQVYVEGKLTTRSYDDRDGNKRYISEVVISEMQMLGAKSDGQREQREQRPAENSSGYGKPQPHHTDDRATGGGEDLPFDEGDSIPF